MPESVARRHWLATVAQRAGLPNAADLTLQEDTPLDAAWQDVADAGGVSQPELATLIAEHLRLPIADLGTADAAALAVLPEAVAHKYGAFPVRLTDRTLTVATASASAASSVSKMACALWSCSAWLSRSIAIQSGSAVLSAITKISDGPAIISMPTCPNTRRFAAAT